MPKKTRREKLLAKEHKRLKALQHLAIIEAPQVLSKNAVSHPSKPARRNESRQVPDSLSNEAVKVRSYFIADFKKSLLYITLIIALEIAVYFGTIKNYFHF